MKNLGISNFTIFSFLVLTYPLLVSCGGAPLFRSPSDAPTTTPVPQTISVTISPSSVGLRRGATWTFTAFTTGNPTGDQTVQWSIQENSTGGTISNQGVFIAPTVDGIYHVVATAVADPTKSAAATVNVGPSGFRLLGSSTAARMAHTATLLPNGTVLIAGGADNYDAVDGYYAAPQAEFFDPASATFTPAGSIYCDFHTATLLLDGNVLLAGGEYQDNHAVLEIGTSGSYQQTGTMASPRESHAATLLTDGSVLISGGFAPDLDDWTSPAQQGMDSPALYSVELYDPRSGTFAVAGNMNVARKFHTSTLLANGKVLITGGGDNSAELFDPATGSFTLTGPMAVARSWHTATLMPDGRVLIVGGQDNGALTAELYDPVSGSFSTTGSMAVPRMAHTATLLQNGTVLIAGGFSVNAETSTTEIYDPATGSFTAGPTMGQGRYWHSATLLPGGNVLFVGGTTYQSGSALASPEIYGSD